MIWIVVTLLIVFALIQYLQVRDLTKEVRAPTLEKEPNQIDEREKELIDFDENTPLDLPKDLKVEIEGGDTLVPPEHDR